MTDNKEKKQENNARTPREVSRTLIETGADKLGLFIDKATEIASKKTHKPVSYYTRFLSRAILLEESGPPRAIITTIGIISLFLFGVITWAAVTTLNETTVARGQITPSSSVKPVQHLEGGIVAQIYIKEGDEVKKGQPMLRLAPTAAMSDLSRIKARHIALILQITRLKAFAEGRKETFSDYKKDYPILVKDQLDVLTQQNKSRDAQQKVIKSQITEKKNELVLLDRKEETEIKNLKIITEELGMRQELTDKGLGSKIMLFEIQRAHNNAQGDLNNTQLTKASINANIAQVKGNLVALNEKFRNEALIQVDSLSGERAQVAAQLTQLNDRVRRLTITAPANGVVTGLKYRTVGSIVTPGDVVAKIVPVTDTLVAEVRISPRDIGHVSVGSKVLIKVDTYNYSRYGSIDSQLSYLSASSFIDETGKAYFKGFINLPQNYIGIDPESNRVTTGMTVVADIQTGHKTLLQYLTKPINNAINTAFRER